MRKRTAVYGASGSRAIRFNRLRDTRHDHAWSAPAWPLVVAVGRSTLQKKTGLAMANRTRALGAMTLQRTQTEGFRPAVALGAVPARFLFVDNPQYRQWINRVIKQFHGTVLETHSLCRSLWAPIPTSACPTELQHAQ